MRTVLLFLSPLPAGAGCRPVFGAILGTGGGGGIAVNGRILNGLNRIAGGYSISLALRRVVLALIARLRILSFQHLFV
jgi:hypothetical protein